MADLAVITASYAPDFEFCRDTVTSVRTYAPAGTVHYVIVPRRDLKLFSEFAGPSTMVWPVERLMPRRVMTVPGANFWVNLRRPFPPIRGWVMQQLVKIQIASEIDADLLLYADSDFIFIRPFTAETFKKDGRVRFYRKEAAIDEGLPRHIIWHNVARDMLGAPRAEPPLPDYIHSPGTWERRKVLAMQDRIRKITGRHWLDVVTSELHFSENILYGVFVDVVLGEDADITVVDSMLCHTYWGAPGSTLSLDEVEKFIDTTPPEDVALWITDRTPVDIRRAALAKSGFLPKVG